MAADQGTYFDATDPEVRSNWEKRLMLTVVKRTSLLNPTYGLIGDDDTSLIQRKKEAFREGGTSARTTLLRTLRQLPAMGGETLRDQEEGLNTATFDWTINYLRHAVKVANFQVTKQRVSWDVMQRSIDALGTYWPQVLEAAMMMHLSGFTVNGATATEWYHRGDLLKATLCNAPRLPDVNHIFRPKDNSAADDSVINADPTAVIDLDTASLLKVWAQQLPIPIRPASTPWGDLYVFLLHPYAVRHLKQNSQWAALMNKTLQGGAIDGNPLFTGALGIYDEVLWVQSNYIPPGFNGSTVYRNVRRNVFCGAQALCMGFAKMQSDENTFTNESESWDYANNKGVAASTFMGAKSPFFAIDEQGTTEDYGKIVVPSYAKELVTSA